MKQKLLSLSVAIMMMFNLFGFRPLINAVGVFAGGTGTATDPWQIATAEQLNNVRNYLGPAHSDKFFVLNANIDLDVPPYNTGLGWEPIGNWNGENSF